MKLLTLILFIFSFSLFGADQQFYFVAKKAPLGSISSYGQNTQGVYLRWDTIEGSLPSEIFEFRLLRDGVDIAYFPAQETMSVSKIDALYSGTNNERRKLETLSKLSQYSASKVPSVSVGLSNFSSELKTQLNEKYWAFLASRVDFNVARSQYRAYLDTNVSSGEHTYELMAVSHSEESKRLAYLTINLDSDLKVPSAKNLVQVSKAQCTSPEYAIDHFTVALHWENAGNNEAEKFLNAVTISGYDIYRSVSHSATDANLGLDIRALAAVASHDDKGTPLLTSVQKVNDSMVIIDSDDNSSEKSVVFLETQDQLKAAGIKPGDKIAYYVVSRDFTGNYGPQRLF